MITWLNSRKSHVWTVGSFACTQIQLHKNSQSVDEPNVQRQRYFEVTGSMGESSRWLTPFPLAAPPDRSPDVDPLDVLGENICKRNVHSNRILPANVSA